MRTLVSTTLCKLVSTLLLLVAGIIPAETEVGITDPGTTSYPNGGMDSIGPLPTPAESDFRCSLMDPEHDAVYYGTNTAPAHIVKVQLSTFRYQGSLVLNSGENALRCAILDAPGHYAFFGTVTDPARIIKIDLDSFTEVGSLTLSPGESIARTAVVDPTTRMGYFATGTSPGRIVKVNLANLTRVGAITLDTGENDPHCAFVDTTRGFAYFGTLTSPGRVVKVDLATFQRTAGLTLWPGYNNLRSALFLPGNNSALFGTYTSPAFLASVNLDTMTQLSGLTLNPDTYLVSAASNPEQTTAYFGTDTSPGRVVAVGTNPLSYIGSLQLGTREGSLWNMNLRPGTHELWCADIGSYGSITRVSTDPFKRLVGLSLKPVLDRGIQALQDDRNQLGYLVGNAAALKLDLADLATPRHLGQYLFEAPPTAGASFPSTDVPIPITDNTWTLSTIAVPSGMGTVLDVNLTGLQLNHTADGNLRLFLRGSNNYDVLLERYRGSDGDNFTNTTFDDQASVSIVNAEPPFTGSFRPEYSLSAFNGISAAGNWTLWVRDDVTGDTGMLTAWSLRLLTTQGAFCISLHDKSSNIVYQAQTGTQTAIQPYDLNSMTLGEARMLPAGVEGVTCAALDELRQLAYLGTGSTPGQLHTIDLQTAARTGGLQLPPGDGAINSVLFDVPTRQAYLVCAGSPATVVQVDVDTMTRVAAASFPAGTPRAGYIDTNHNRLCYPMEKASGLLVGIAAFALQPLADGMTLDETYSSDNLQFALPLRGGDWALVGGASKTYRFNLVHPGVSILGSSRSMPWTLPADRLAFQYPLEVRSVGRLPAARGTALSLPSDSVIHTLNFPVHQAVGNARFAIYRNQANTATLLWQSPEIPLQHPETTLSIPTSLGYPEGLVLTAGNYWLTWQTETLDDAPGYIANHITTGCTFPMPFGPFPEQMTTATGFTTTTDNWAESLIVEPVLTAPSAATFDTFPAEWTFHDVPELPAIGGWSPPGRIRSGALTLSSTASDGCFAFWESPLYYTPSQPATGALAASFRTWSDQANHTLAPEYRIRISSDRYTQSDVLTLDSNAGALLSPNDESPVDATLFWAPPPTDPAFRLAFDIVNYSPEDAPDGTIMLDNIGIRTIPQAAFESPRAEQTFSFDSTPEGFLPHTVPSLIPPEFAHDQPAGRLAIRTTPFPSDPPDPMQFGWWGSREDGDQLLRQEPARLYYADFHISTDIPDPALVPTFRLRINDSHFQASSALVVSSTTGSNSPSTASSKTYRVFFPPDLTGPDGHLIFSFDLLTAPADQDTVGSSIYLEDLTVWSIPLP